MVSELNLRIKFSAGGKLPLIVVFSTKKKSFWCFALMFGAKKNLFTSNYRCIRELLRWLFYLLSQNTKWRSKLNMELWLNDFWVLTSLLREQKDVLLCGQHNVMIWRTWKTEIQNERGIRYCVQLRHSSDTSSFLVEVAFKFFAFYPNCIPSLSLNASQKTQYLCGQEFGGIVTFAQTFLLFLRVCPKIQQQNKKLKTPKTRNLPCPRSVKKKHFYSH